MYHSLKVIKIIKETPNSVSIELEVPENIKANFQFKAGQFLTFDQEVKGKRIKRSYSICSAPSSGFLKVGIKAIENGLFSNFACYDLKEGDYLTTSKPVGKFVIEPDKNKAEVYAFFGAGSGITPLLSMIKTILFREPKSTVHLFYGNKDEEHTIFKQEIDQLQNKYDHFSVQYFYSKSYSDDFNSGRISKEKLSGINDLINLNAIDSFYFCGPEAMIMDLKEGLINSYGINKEILFYELFTSSKKKSKEKIKTDTKKAIIGMNGEFHTIELKPNETILEAGLRSGLDMPHACMSGNCGTCECTVNSGEIKLINNMALSEQEIFEQKTLACQTQVVSDEVKIFFR